jgi:autotransporter-associated beta strand protein
LGYTLGTAAHAGTLTFSANSGQGSNLTANILYQGTNTATETINSDIAITTGGSVDLSIANTTTSGVLTFNGDISNSSAVAGSIVVKGSGNINLDGTIGGAVGTGNVASNVLTVAMTAGTLTITGSNTAPTGNMALGNSSYSGGNVLIETSNPWGNTSVNILNLAAGANGTFQLEGTTANPNLTLPNSFNTAVARTAGDAGGTADIESISGNNSMGSLTFGPGVSTSGYLNVESDAGSTLTVAGVIDSRTSVSAGLGTVLFYGGGNGVVSAAISDSVTAGDTVAVAKDGSGTWILAGNDTNTGGTTISGGTLQVGNGSTSGSLGSGGVTDNGILQYNRTDAVIENNVITGTGSVSLTGSGTTTFTQANTYSGGTTISAGTFQASNSTGSATGSGAVALGAATLTGTGSISGIVTAHNGASSLIAPGTSTSTGNLSLGGIASLSGLTLNFTIDGPGDTTSTLTLGSAGLTSTGGPLTFNLYDLGQGDLSADTPYAIITSTGTLSASSVVANLFDSAYVLNTSYGTNGILFSDQTVTFEVAVAPEPDTGALVLSGLLLAIVYRGWAMRKAGAKVPAS